MLVGDPEMDTSVDSEKTTAVEVGVSVEADDEMVEVGANPLVAVAGGTLVFVGAGVFVGKPVLTGKLVGVLVGEGWGVFVADGVALGRVLGCDVGV